MEDKAFWNEFLYLFIFLFVPFLYTDDVVTNVRNNIRNSCLNLFAEAKQEFDGNCSVHVYSVQACIPKDPAALWNAEFVQAEELFRQPPTMDNCLRDNRYSSSMFNSCFGFGSKWLWRV